MALKQNRDGTDNLRQAIEPFRDAFEAMSSPLPRGLETMLQMERLMEALDAGLPLMGFGPFDGLGSGADIDVGNTATTGNLPEQHPDMDLERFRPAENRGEGPRVKGRNPAGGIENHSRGNIDGSPDAAWLAPWGQEIPASDTPLEIPAKANNEPLKQKKEKQRTGDGGMETISLLRVPAMAPCPDASGSSRSRERNPGAVENTLAAVDTLAEELLDDDRQIHAERNDVYSGLKGRSKEKQMEVPVNVSTDMPPVAGVAGGGVPEEKALGHTGREIYSYEKSRQIVGHSGVAENTLPGSMAFAAGQTRGHNAGGRDGVRPLTDCLARVGMLADEILRASTGGGKMDVKAKPQSRVGGGGNNPAARAADRVAGDGGPDMKVQQPQDAFFSMRTGSVTEVVINDAMQAGFLDKDAVTALVNEVLVEQARRHGVNLS